MRDEHVSSGATPDPADAPGLIQAALQQALRLVQNEFALMKREMASKASRAAAGIAMMIFAGFLVMSALDVLTAAAVTGIAALGLPLWASSLIVGAAALALAALFFVVGRHRLTSTQLTPERSVKNIRRDIETLKETANV
ncbi:phage holin family protein [uncultured Roseobacter sp.]|uniref:phage holin family protein n=1 Tax=uncultured Roseobacter sp. TaxID=114847 RepID=UPI002619E744|nr:phage holin family protein [uncultured Roseobacter sp.]